MSDPEEQAREEEAKRRFQFQKKVDSDWKRKVQLEKQRLAGQAAPQAPPPPKTAKKAEPEKPPASRGVDMGFLALVQQLADQAALFLGLVPGYAERNCEQALAAIEMLRSLNEKTRGNLGAEESKALESVLYELQMRYVQSCGGGAAP